MYMLSLNISAPPGKRVEMLKSLKLLTGPVAVEPGCQLCRVYEDARVQGDFFIVEEWESQADLIRYFKSAHFKKLLALTEVADFSPQIRCQKLHHTDGVKYIQSLICSST